MKLELTKKLKQKPKFNEELGFGKYFSDHVIEIEYDGGKWQEMTIKPFSDLHISPTAFIFHYGQGIFEGIKAFKTVSGEISVFRLKEYMKRLKRSMHRMSIPEIDTDALSQAIKQWVGIEKDWVPSQRGFALYIRPFAFATETGLGVKPSGKYKFLVLGSPVASYYGGSLKPISLLVSEEYSRAAKGGTGNIKSIGNYAGSLFAATDAKNKGYDQVLWLNSDGFTNVEEVGTMNIFVVMNDKIVTPKLNGSIMPGITRKSILELCEKRNLPVEERLLPVAEVIEKIESNELSEIFGSGTAAIVTPVNRIGFKGKDYTINNNEIGKYTKLFYDTILDIQVGNTEDCPAWREIV